MVHYSVGTCRSPFIYFPGNAKINQREPKFKRGRKGVYHSAFMIGWLVMFICVYIVRIVVKALLKLVGVHDATSGNP